MKVVQNKNTGRLVYREQPDFKKGYGIANAVIWGCGDKGDLREINATQAEWDEEMELQKQEAPPTTQEQIDALKDRVSGLETTLNPQ